MCDACKLYTGNKKKVACAKNDEEHMSYMAMEAGEWGGAGQLRFVWVWVRTRTRVHGCVGVGAFVYAHASLHSILYVSWGRFL